jgi:hypothetical protein
MYDLTPTPTDYSAWDDYSALFPQVKLDQVYTNWDGTHRVKKYTELITNKLINHFNELKRKYIQLGP